MDTRTQAIPSKAVGTPAIRHGSGSPGQPTVSISVGQVKTPQQVQGESIKTIIPLEIVADSFGPKPPTYNGRRLRELGCLLTQPHHLVSPEVTEQFTRVYYHKGNYVVGPNGPRLGISVLWEAHFVEGTGMTLVFNTGHHLMIQAPHCQVTYVPE